MSQRKVRAALEGRLATWASTRVAGALPVVYENVEATPAIPHLRAFLLPALTGSDDLKGDHRSYIGVFQVSIVMSRGGGPGAAEGIAQEIAELFPVNLRITSSGFTVMVLTPVATLPAVQEPDLYTLPVSFTYRADTV